MEDIILKSMPEDGVMQVSLNRPKQRNALSNDLIAKLAEIFEVAWDSSGVRCCVLVGGGDIFSAGADIKEMEADGINAIDNIQRKKNWALLEQFPKPIIASVEG